MTCCSDVWEYPDPGITRAVDHAINRLRTKIEPDAQEPLYIHTAVGVGYFMTPEGLSTAGEAPSISR